MSRTALLPLLACLAGCAAGGGGLTAFEREELERRERGLAIATQRVHDPDTLARIGVLLARLDPKARPRVYVLEHPAPQAELIGGQVLLVRTGLLDAVRSDDELAFVLAHELAHDALGHMQARRLPDWDALGAEIGADRWAQAALARAGWHPAAGAELLGRIGPTIEDDEARAIVGKRREALLTR